MEKSIETFKADFNGQQVVITRDFENNRVTASHSIRNTNLRKQITVVHNSETNKTSINIDGSEDVVSDLEFCAFMNTQITNLLNTEENA